MSEIKRIKRRTARKRRTWTTRTRATGIRAPSRRIRRTGCSWHDGFGQRQQE